MRPKDKAIFKFNGGLGALLCSGCSVIIRTGSSFTDDERKAMRGEIDLEPCYCDKCKETGSSRS